MHFRGLMPLLATENDEQDHRLLFKVNNLIVSDFEKDQASHVTIQREHFWSHSLDDAISIE